MKPIYYPAILAAGMVAGTFAEETTGHGNHSDSGPILENLNPEISVIIDGFYYNESSDQGLGSIKGEMPGFGHAHGDDEHGHGHEKENGFNLREVELNLAGTVDGYFRADATLSFSEEEAEVEVAEIETTSLPWGFTLKAGKFFSDFGIVNKQHPHQWSFTDQPLIYELTLGDHGINEVGLQAAWQLEAPFFLRVGAEALQGDNEALFAYEGDGAELPEHNGPRLGIGWLKFGPDLGHANTLRFGGSIGSGIHQEAHEETPGVFNYLDGDSTFAGLDAFYHHSAHGDRGQGDITVQGEYFWRNKDLDLVASDDPLAPIGEKLDSNQDGYYLQALYGFFPRWRGGLRWDQVGLTNNMQEPGEPSEQFGDSWRATAMVDFSPSKYSLLRLQASNGDYETATGSENVWEVYAQLVITLGSHTHEGEHVCSGH